MAGELQHVHHCPSLSTDTKPLILAAHASSAPVKHCVRLRESAKYRGETGSALICGRDLVQELAPLVAPMRALVALDGEALPGMLSHPRLPCPLATAVVNPAATHQHR